MEMGSPTEQVRQWLKREVIEPARKRHDSTVRIVVGDVARALKLNNRTPLICAALRSRKLLQENHLVIEKDEGPRSGLSTTVVLTYRLVADEKSPARPDDDLWSSLRGVLKDTYGNLGGGEALIRKQREHFYEPDQD